MVTGRASGLHKSHTSNPERFFWKNIEEPDLIWSDFWKNRLVVVVVVVVVMLVVVVVSVVVVIVILYVLVGVGTLTVFYI